MFVSGILCITLFGVIVGLQVAVDERQAIEDRAQGIARATAALLEREIAAAEAILSTLATTRSLAEGRLESFYRIAAGARRIKGDTIILFDPSGKQLLNAIIPFGEPPPGRPAQAAISLAVQTGKPVVSDVFYGSFLGHWEFLVLVPVSRDGAVTHVLGMAVSCETMSTVLAASDLPAEWLAGIVDRNGVIVARSRDFAAYVGKPGAPELRDAVTDAATGGFSGASLEGAPFYNRFLRSDLTGWTVAIGVPQAVVAAPLRRALLTIAAVVGALAAIGILLFLRVARRIAAPIEALVPAAAAIGRGEVVGPIRSRLTEIGRVSTAFAAAGALLRERDEARRQAQELLSESEQRFREYAESASDWLWETGPDLRFTSASQRLTAITGLTAADVIGKRREDLGGARTMNAAWRRHLDDLRNHRPFRDFSYELPVPDGTHHVRISGIPRFAADGAFLGYRGVGADITAEVEARRESERLAERLRESIEALSEGFGLYDAEERLVLCNARMAEMFGWSAELIALRPSWEELLRHNVRRGIIDLGDRDEAGFVAKRLNQFRSGTAVPVEQRFSDGRWMRCNDYPTGSGGTICLRTDITDLKHSQELLVESIESLSEGFALFDADERLVLANRRYREIYPWNASLIQPGVGFERLVRSSARQWSLGQPRGDAEAWIVHRLQQFRAPGPALEVAFPDGRWILTSDYRTPSGGTISLRSDITELKRIEQRLRDAINSVPDGFVLWDAEDRLVLCNGRFREIYPHLSGIDVAGRSFIELTQPLLDGPRVALDDGQTPEEWLAARHAAHLDLGGEPFLLHFADGRWIEIRESRTGEGGRVSTCIDITERKLAEQALRESEAKFRSFLTASSDAMLVVDERGTIVLASMRTAELFGYAEGELTGQPIHLLVPQHFRSQHRGHLANYIAAPRLRQMAVGVELQARRKDGSEFPAEIGLSPHRTAEGLLVLAAVRDLTTRHNAEEALRAVQKMEALGTLAGGIAHDLNNTLVPILGLTQITMDSLAADSPVQEYLADVIAAAGRARDLVQQIVAFSRTETAERVPINLARAIPAALRLCARRSPRPLPSPPIWPPTRRRSPATRRKYTR